MNYNEQQESRCYRPGVTQITTIVSGDQVHMEKLDHKAKTAGQLQFKLRYKRPTKRKHRVRQKPRP